MRSSKQAFSLIAVLIMVALLTVVIVAFAALLRMETSSSGNAGLRSQARQNALLGINIALGELQREMGPDQRISSSAAILTTSTSVQTSDVAQAHWTGVWNSSSWNSATADTPMPPSYENKKISSFRRWLVSVPKSASQTSDESQDINLAKNPNFSDKTKYVTMVGQKTANDPSGGTYIIPSVQVWKVDADTDQAGRVGKYAWWVGDEGIKAKLNIVTTQSTAALNATGSNNNSIFSLASAPRNAVEAVKAYDSIVYSSTINDGLNKVLIPKALNVAYNTNLDNSFYDFTVYSSGVLSDVQNGGLKKDLNLLLELPQNQLPSYVFSSGGGAASGTFAAAISGTYQKIYSRTYSGETMGPDWGLIYRYYNLYKSPYLEKSAATTGYVFRMDPYNIERTATGDRDFIIPQVLRIQYLIGFYTDKPFTYTTGTNTYIEAYPTSKTDVLYMACYPIMYLWNPYNIQIRHSSTAENSALSGALAVAQGGVTGGNAYTEVMSLPNPAGMWINFGGSNRSIANLQDSSAISQAAGTNVTLTAAHSVYQPYQGSLATIWLNGQGTVIDSFAISPGAIKVLSLGNNGSDAAAIADRYWQDSYYITGSNTVNRKGLSRKVPAVVGWTGTSIPMYSDILSNNPDNHLSAGDLSNLKLGYDFNTDDGKGLRQVAFGRTLFNENEMSGASNLPLYPNGRSRMVGTTEINTYNALLTTGIADAGLTYKSYSSSDFSLNAGSGMNNINLAFSINYNYKAHPFDIVQKSKFLLFSDPLEKSYVIFGADQAAAQMAPVEFTVQAITGNLRSSSIPKNYPEGTNAVKVSGTADGYFGTDTEKILSNVAVEFPVLPLTTISQLQNVALGRDYTHPVYRVINPYAGLNADTLKDQKYEPQGAVFFHAVGNSYAHPLIPASQLASTQNSANNITGRSFDHSFYANNVFWDSYFFSGITPQQSIAFSSASTQRSISQVLDDFVATGTQHKNLPVTRLQPWIGSNYSSTDLKTNLLSSGTNIRPTAYSRSAAWLMMDGVFNINSTSVEAWTAVLAGALGQKVSFFKPNTTTGYPIGKFDSNDLSVTSETPFSRLGFMSTTASVNGVVKADPATPQTYWNGYRALTKDQCRNLAVQLVQQIKQRGPFLSLAEFVNRQVSSNTDLNQSGALQAAIDAAGLNGDTSVLNRTIEKVTNTSSKLPNSAAGNGQMTAGSNGFLMQADVLKLIGSYLSARSDTFVIRAYGEVEGKNGQILSKAWCEAVVQRTPEFIDQTDAVLSGGVNGAGNATDIKLLNSINQTFGRRFRIVQFRWLTQDQI